MSDFFCPVNGWDCPHWYKDGTCELGKDAALRECDDAAIWDWAYEDEEEED